MTRISGQLRQDTGKAICLHIGHREVWIPRSVCNHISKHLDQVTVEVEDWFARREDLEHES